MFDVSVVLDRKDSGNTWVTVTVQDLDSDFSMSRTVKLFRSLYEMGSSFHSASATGFISRDGAKCVIYSDVYCQISLPTCYGYNNGHGIKYTGNYHQVLYIHLPTFFKLPY